MIGDQVPHGLAEMSRENEELVSEAYNQLPVAVQLIVQQIVQACHNSASRVVGLWGEPQSGAMRERNGCPATSQVLASGCAFLSLFCP